MQSLTTALEKTAAFLRKVDTATPARSKTAAGAGNAAPVQNKQEITRVAAVLAARLDKNASDVSEILSGVSDEVFNLIANGLNNKDDEKVAELGGVADYHDPSPHAVTGGTSDDVWRQVTAKWVSENAR